MLGTELRHSDPLTRAIAMEGYQRLIQLIARHLTHHTKRKALTIASGIMSTLVGAVALAEVAPDSAVACAILKDAKTVINQHMLRG
jgi:TetR/AcrR family transcriptional repressor of nem operon